MQKGTHSPRFSFLKYHFAEPEIKCLHSFETKLILPRYHFQHFIQKALHTLMTYTFDLSFTASITILKLLDA